MRQPPDPPTPWEIYAAARDFCRAQEDWLYAALYTDPDYHLPEVEEAYKRLLEAIAAAPSRGRR